MLRPYQQGAVNAVTRSFIAGKRAVLLVAPTGSGKTTMGVHVAQRSKARRVLWLVHQQELVQQALDRMVLEVGASHCSLDLYDERAAFRFGTVQSLTNRLDNLPDASIAIYDEAHHSKASTWEKVLMHYREQSRLLGLTATPERSDKQGLGDVFDDMVVAASYSELIEQGHLVRALTFSSRINRNGAMAQEPIDAYRKHAQGLAGFGFTTSIDRAQELSQSFNAAGVPCAAMWGNMSNRNEVLDDFRSGKLKFLWSVNLLTEGVDVPEAEVCILACQYGHRSRYMQAVGRVLRPSQGKDRGIVLDLCGNAFVHGSADEDREFSLHGEAISSSAKKCEPRMCPSCGCIMPYGENVCRSCGFEMLKSETRPPEITGDELREFSSLDAYDAMSVESAWQKLSAKARSNGWAVSWAINAVRKQFRISGWIPTDVDEHDKKHSYFALLDRNENWKRAYGIFIGSFGEKPPYEWKREWDALRPADEAAE